MALYAVHIANGTSSNTSLLRLFGRYLSGTGVVQPGAFTVSAQASPNMTVKVSGSAILDDLVIRPTFGGTYHGWNTGTENVTIPSNATGITKIDHVVAYIDTAFSSGTADNPGALVLTTVRGTGTAAPSDAEINTALSSKPWIRLAEVTVANGASSINSGNITDKRPFARLDGGLLSAASVPSTAMASEAWTTYTPTWTTDGTAPSLGNGTITGRYRKLGRDVRVSILLIYGSTTTSGSGVFMFSLPVSKWADGQNQTYPVGNCYVTDAGISGYPGQAAITGTGAGATYANKVQIFTTDITNYKGKAITGTVPFTFGTGDTIAVEFSYEADS